MVSRVPERTGATESSPAPFPSVKPPVGWLGLPAERLERHRKTLFKGVAGSPAGGTELVRASAGVSDIAGPFGRVKDL